MHRMAFQEDALMFAFGLRLRHWKPPPIVTDALPPLLMRDGL